MLVVVKPLMMGMMVPVVLGGLGRRVLMVRVQRDARRQRQARYRFAGAGGGCTGGRRRC